jgi:pilus assembly protein Flp/PilA
MRAIVRSLRAFAADEVGATAIEYGLICSLIVLVILAAMQAVAGATTAMYDLIVNAMGV